MGTVLRFWLNLQTLLTLAWLPATCQAIELEHVIQTGHTSLVTSVAWSPDGKMVVTGSWDKTAIIWNGVTGEQLRTLAGHTEKVTTVAWSPDGNSVVTGSDDKTAIIWNAVTGEKLQTLTGLKSLIYSVAWSPDGKALVSALANNTTIIWNADTGKQLRILAGHTGNVTTVAWSPDGKTIVTGSWDKTAIIWNAVTGQQLRTLSGHEKSLVSAAWSPDGKTLVTGSEDRTAIIWNAVTGEKHRTLTGHQESLTSVTWCPDGKTLITGSYDGTAILWDALTGKQLRTFAKQKDWLICADWNPDGKTLVTGFSGGRAIIWNAQTGEQLRTLTGSFKSVSNVAWSPDGKLLVTVERWKKKVNIWNATTGEKLRTLPKHSENVNCVAWNPDSKTNMLVTNSGDTAILWNAVTGDKLQTLSGHTTSISCVAWSPDGKMLVTGSYDKTAILWNAATGRKLRTLAGHQGSVDSVVWNPNGKSLMTNSGMVANFWDLATEEKIKSIDFLALERISNELLNDRPVAVPFYLNLCMSWSPDNMTLVTGSTDKTAILWDALLEGKRLTLTGHRGSVSSVAWSPSGKTLATGSADNSMILWNAVTGEKLHEFNGHTGTVNGVAWSSDGKILVSASEDSSTRLWDIASNKEMVALYSFDDDTEWLALTTEGYFDGSVNGSKYLRYRIKGTNDLVPLERYREKFEVPGLLAKIWKGEPITKSGEIVKLDLPPLGKLVNPAVKTEVKQGKLTVKASAASRGQYPVTKFRLLVNKKPYAVKEGLVEIASPKLGNVEASWDIDLEPGSHELSVVSYNDVTFHITDPVEVLYLGGGLANTDLPTLYVLSVGISTYKEQPLDFAHRDAQAIADAYATHSKPLFKKIVVKTLVNEQATREAILDELTALRKNMTQRDYGVFFFAGHGVRDARDKLYFLPHDGKRERLSSTAIDAEAVKDEIVSTPGQLLVMLDACHAGSILAGARSLTDNLIKDLSAEDKGVAVMCSSTGNEISVEDRQHQHGRFTLALLEAIRGEGTKDLPIRKVDGAVYFKQIDSYVTDRVKTLSGGEQHPVTGFPRQFRDFPLSKP